MISMQTRPTARSRTRQRIRRTTLIVGVLLLGTADATTLSPVTLAFNIAVHTTPARAPGHGADGDTPYLRVTVLAPPVAKPVEAKVSVDHGVLQQPRPAASTPDTPIGTLIHARHSDHRVDRLRACRHAPGREPARLRDPRCPAGSHRHGRIRSRRRWPGRSERHSAAADPRPGAGRIVRYRGHSRLRPRCAGRQRLLGSRGGTHAVHTVYLGWLGVRRQRRRHHRPRKCVRRQPGRREVPVRRAPCPLDTDWSRGRDPQLQRLDDLPGDRADMDGHLRIQHGGDHGVTHRWSHRWTCRHR